MHTHGCPLPIGDAITQTAGKDHQQEIGSRRAAKRLAAVLENNTGLPVLTGRHPQDTMSENKANFTSGVIPLSFFLKRLFFFLRADLGSQQNCAEGKETFHVSSTHPHTRAPLICIPHQRSSLIPTMSLRRHPHIVACIHGAPEGPLLLLYILRVRTNV